MLLLAAVPTVSQVLGVHAGVHEHMALAGDGEAHAHHHETAPGHRGVDDCWQKCGYCDFLAHAPLLDAFVHAGAFGVVHPFVPSHGRVLQPRYARVLQIAQPRGPPEILV